MILVDHYVRCTPCGVSQRCPKQVDQTCFVVEHAEHGAIGWSESYYWPPTPHPDAELRRVMQAEHELDYYDD